MADVDKEGFCTTRTTSDLNISLTAVLTQPISIVIIDSWDKDIAFMQYADYFHINLSGKP